ncbi:unnamed protein product [Ceutorhynchus assimilis]|uniref:Uncharacterized protein n=1 Tax=Ceutorhynchus assimilis TaxID=467358 RepID=A0A9N9MNB8_9CUCU|nr:unnamed protein product [Ceutorhynchus assimilis]
MVNPLFISLCIILAILFGRMTNVDIMMYESKLLAQASDIIERGNFSYYYIYSAGPLILNLTSLLGDADLYISDTNMYPTYDADSYKLHSATCGQDIIEIPESFEYPLAVGIYGHAEYSVFTLEIWDVPNYEYKNKYWLLVTKDAPTNIDETTRNEDTNKKTNNKPISKKKKAKSTSSTASSIFSLLEVIQLIFL